MSTGGHKVKRNKIALAGTALFVIGALALAGCASGGNESNGDAGGNVNADAIITTNGSEPENPLIPTNTNEVGGGKILDEIFAGLIYYDAEGLSHMGVAESIEAARRFEPDIIVMDVRLPDAGFYLWAGVPAAWQGDDVAFASELLATYNVTVLPGSYLARAVNGANPGQGRVRIALVAETERCVEGAKRLRAFCESGR